MNRDKIENEEQRKLIQMDIDEHQVAVFTKEKEIFRTELSGKIVAYVEGMFCSKFGGISCI